MLNSILLQCTLAACLFLSCSATVIISSWSETNSSSIYTRAVFDPDDDGFKKHRLCGLNEVLELCPDDCPTTDECPNDRYYNRPCPKKKRCSPKCKCMLNYRRSKSGVCIPSDECPPFDCGDRPNEIYSACPIFCPSQNCPTRPGLTDICPLILPIFPCKPLCICDSGYRRNKLGICVPLKDCFNTCSINEEFTTCTIGIDRPQYCAQINETLLTTSGGSDICESGCICKEGYLRNENGTCVREDDCGNICSTNEEFTTCTIAIDRPQYCAQINDTESTNDGSDICESGCVCKEGYLRTENGTCVKEDDCNNQPQCDDTEIVVNCVNDDYCPKNEDDRGPVLFPVTPICDKPGCQCRYNYKRTENGTCVPITDCPPFDCSGKPNEVYNACPSDCPSDSCFLASPTGSCLIIGRIGIIVECNPKCVCIEGYWRNDDGICVPHAECPNICSTNEEFTTCTVGIDRPQNCAQINETLNITNPGSDICESGCVCKEGYLRTENGTCVREDECGNPPQCDDTEIAVNCVNDDYCPKSDDRGPVLFPVPPVCDKPGCQCRLNYKRTVNGTCVPIADCPPFDCDDRPNEIYSACPLPCPGQECPTRPGLTDICPLLIPVYPCIPQCICDSGYRRNELGICVPLKDCFNTCSTNEEFTTCTIGIDRPQYCAQINETLLTTTGGSDICESGCICKEGYLRTENGTCVREDDCGNICSTNEEFTTCIIAIDRPQTCAQFKDTESTNDGSDVCMSGCVCKEGYLRTENGTCVKEDECNITPQCDETEIVTNCVIDDYCPKSEDDSGPVLFPVTPVCDKPRCQCRYNYKRNENGTCVPITDCPPLDCSGKPNEVYNSCPPYCPSDSCSHATAAGHCLIIGRIGITVQCNPRCICIEGFWRNDDGICVPYAECSNICSTNEEFTTCTVAINRPQNCAQINETLSTTNPGSDICESGCVCKEGYLRTENGTCVREDDCENICSTNEEFTTCTLAIDRPQNCAQINETQNPTNGGSDICESGCVCKEGYLRTENGTCVKEDDCNIPPQCDDTEIAVNCINDDRSDNCPTSDNDTNPVYPLLPDCDKPGCQCRFNYKRTDNGTCVPTRDCPPFDCSGRPNEVYNACPSYCPSDSCSQASPSGRCPIIGRIGIIVECQPKCVCIEGFWRNDDGICVPYAECPGVCGENEVYINCTQSVCRPTNCSQFGSSVQCLNGDESECQPGCVCKEEYLRSENGTCVHENHCDTYDRCKGPYEVYSDCKQICPPETCVSLLPVKYDCQYEECKPGCNCLRGYLRRNNTAPCMPQCQCPELKHSHECRIY